MSSSLADYLAKNYLTADPPKKPTKKKRKRKGATADDSSKTPGLIIADDDAAGWDIPNANPSDDDDIPVIAGVTKAFKKATKSNWLTIINTAETAAADAILAANTDGKTVDEGPTVVEEGVGVQKMSSGAHAGLQTAEQVEAQLAAAKEEERMRFAAADPAESGKGQETIYRDASGRIINVAMQRAEARKMLQEEEEKKSREKEMQKGEVQKLEAMEKAKRLDDAKYMKLARYADDKELNDELKEQGRWNDPAAAFLTKKKVGGKSKTGRPVYQGPAAPNRFGIRPGHRWDGVDRANGFETKWFQAQNRKKERTNLMYESQYDI